MYLSFPSRQPRYSPTKLTYSTNQLLCHQFRTSSQRRNLDPRRRQRYNLHPPTNRSLVVRVSPSFPSPQDSKLTTNPPQRNRTSSLHPLRQRPLPPPILHNPPPLPLPLRPHPRLLKRQNQPPRQRKLPHHHRG
jgi:hypothetical protein